MDSITHIVLGATVGEALAGRRLGKKALLLGAIANSLPDIDFVASFWLDTAHDVEAHRGITHSFLFVAVVGALMAAISSMFGRKGNMSFGRWYFFYGLLLFLHVFIDAFNAYGTGWFEPFSHYRVSFNTLFVADPFFTAWLLISTLMLLILRRGHRARAFWVGFGLILSGCYLYYALLNKYKIDKIAKHEIARHGIRHIRYFTTPTPMNTWLWYIVAEDTAGFHTGYVSLFDTKALDSFNLFRRNDSLLRPLLKQEDVQALLRFSDGYYTVEEWKAGRPLKDTLASGAIVLKKDTTEKANLREGRLNTERDTLQMPDSVKALETGQKPVKDTLVFNVLRFEQMKGWEDGRNHFVFHYFLERPGDNMVILQRGRFAGWTRETVDAFVRRIRGN